MRLPLLLMLAALGLPAAAQAKPLKVSPKKQAITLGGQASVRVYGKPSCRITQGISAKSVTRSRIRGGVRFRLTPARARTYNLRFRCASGSGRAQLKVRTRSGGPGTPGGPAAPDPDRYPNSRLGSNLAAVTYYDGAVPFSDLMMQSGDWLDSFEAGPGGYPARLAPGEEARLPVAELSYPAGSYRVSWSGSGSFRVGEKSFSGRNGSGSVSLDGSSLVLLTVSQTDPADPLHAVKLMAPGESGVFRSAYLAQLSPYRVLRFMDWQRTNGTFSDPVPSLSCASRARLSSYSQGSRRGASFEMMVDLANQAKASPWFTVPHKADESFVRCLAQVVKGRLDASLTPRFEFSNETWNPSFEQFHDLTDAGRSLGGGDDFLGLQRLHARRHRQMVSAVRSEMGERRFIAVMSGQAANPWVLEQRLSFEGASSDSDELAIAPYVGLHEAFDPGEASRISSMSSSELFGELNSRLSGEVSEWVASHRQLADRFSRPLVAYEGGQHLAGDSSNSRLTELFTSANRDSRMGELYDRLFAAWDRASGNGLFVHFTDVGPYTRFGSWGALEPGQSSSPKYQALLRQAGR